MSSVFIVAPSHKNQRIDYCGVGPEIVRSRAGSVLGNTFSGVVTAMRPAVQGVQAVHQRRVPDVLQPTAERRLGPNVGGATELVVLRDDGSSHVGDRADDDAEADHRHAADDVEGLTRVLQQKGCEEPDHGQRQDGDSVDRDDCYLLRDEEGGEGGFLALHCVLPWRSKVRVIRNGCYEFNCIIPQP